MSDLRDRRQQALFADMRAIEPPPELQQEVYAALASRRRPRSRRVLAIGALAATVSTAVAFVTYRRWKASGPQERMATVIAAQGATQAGRVVASGDILDRAIVVVDHGGRLDAVMGDSTIRIEEASAFALSDHRVVLQAGAMSLTGALTVSSILCTAQVRGHSRVAASEGGLEIVVIQGDVTVEQPGPTCSVRRQSPASNPTASAPAEILAPTPPPVKATEVSPEIQDADRGSSSASRSNKRHRRKPLAPAAQAPNTDEAPDTLAEQARAYWAAVELRRSSPPDALRALRAFQTKWPDSPFHQEADLLILDTLVDEGRIDEARAEAHQFLDRYPDSPQAAKVRALVDPEK